VTNVAGKRMFRTYILIYHWAVEHFSDVFEKTKAEAALRAGCGYLPQGGSAH